MKDSRKQIRRDIYLLALACLLCSCAFWLAGMKVFSRTILVPAEAQPGGAAVTFKSTIEEIESILQSHKFIRTQVEPTIWWWGEDNNIDWGVDVKITMRGSALSVRVRSHTFDPALGSKKKLETVFDEIRDLLEKRYGDQIEINEHIGGYI